MDLTAAAVAFTIHVAAAFTPAAPTVLAPSGSIATLAPTYKWTAVAGATDYYLWVTTDGRGPVIQRWYQNIAPDGCDSSMCSVTPQIVLRPNSSHTVWVQAWNPEDGYSEWSQGVQFSTGPYPPGPTAYTPSGVISTPQPPFNWQLDPLAYAYEIWVGRTGETTPVVREAFDTATYCLNGGCRAWLSVELPDGAYTFWVLPIYSLGSGNWGSPKTFTVAAPVPAAPQLIHFVNDMIAVTTPTSPSYSWSSAAGTWFYLWIESEDRVVLHTKWYRATDVCLLAIGSPPCIVQAAVELPLDKSYRWWVQAWNSRGYGPWSAPAMFHVTSHVPGAATPLAPSGPGADANPVFTWRRELSSRYYRLSVNRVGGALVATDFLTALWICDWTTCSYRLGLNLPPGSYEFRLVGVNEPGVGPWSQPMEFQR